jgi:hypothetical protein
MTTVATSIPDNLRLNLHQGEEIQFHALVQQDGSFLVTSVLHRQTPPTVNAPSALVDPPQTLGDWARKWAGTLHLAEGESPQSLREAYMTEKFGA